MMKNDEQSTQQWQVTGLENEDNNNQAAPGELNWAVGGVDEVGVPEWHVAVAHQQGGKQSAYSELMSPHFIFLFADNLKCTAMTATSASLCP